MARDDETRHQQILEALPFYLNGTLNAQESAPVAEHLKGCVACRTELDRCRELSAVARTGEEWSPSPRDWAAMAAKLTASTASARNPLRDLFAKVRGWFEVTPVPMRWAFALQGALVLALAGSLLLRPGGPAVYETLSNPERVAPSDRARLHLVFAEDATEPQMRALLQEMKAVIVSGPSPTGVYTVALPFAASDRKQLDEAAARAKANPKVRFAAPPG
jgi:hypothetical protein